MRREFIDVQQVTKWGIEIERTTKPLLSLGFVIPFAEETKHEELVVSTGPPVSTEPAATVEEAKVHENAPAVEVKEKEQEVPWTDTHWHAEHEFGCNFVVYDSLFARCVSSFAKL